jgi:hypothetical protein
MKNSALQGNFLWHMPNAIFTVLSLKRKCKVVLLCNESTSLALFILDFGTV